MKTINDDTIKQLIAWRTFKTNVHQAANTLKQSDNDAQQELLNELFSHRFNRYTATELAELIAAHDTNIGWSITYARLDLISKHYKQLGKRAQMEHAAELEDVSTGIIKLADDNGNTTSINEYQLAKVTQQFATQSSRLFCDLLLRYGKTETMIQMGLTNKQFNRKLRNCLAYVAKHSDKFSLVTDRERDRQLYVLNSLNGLFSIIDKAGNIQEWINSHVKLVNELLADSDVRYQGAVLNHWETASKSDQYAFIRECIGAQTKAQQWLDQSNEAIKQAGEAQSN